VKSWGAKWLFVPWDRSELKASSKTRLLGELTALQSYPATRVGPVVLVMQIVIPVLLAPLVGGERWGAGGPVLAAALVVVAGGVALLASSRAIGEFEHERRRGGESGEGEILRLARGERAPEGGGKAGA